jgi:ABC-type polysaccharide/polyol phosphate transport system ATPase subunit
LTAALEFERVTKEFVGARSYRALRDDLVGAAMRSVGRRREPRALIKALDDISFQVEEGESFGLIGRNGAGKTTALKIATRITYPSRGHMRVRGRVGALIEVGTGMHPELTGRENVRLYGQIIGLARRDIDRRFDEIVDFAGVARAIDQPVKHYSSGMQLRLGFSIAAHLEPDVLLVDEAIAVGDAGFQHRCVERMAELVRQGGTLVFVSHDMSAIETLCSRAILLDQGTIAQDGPAQEVVRDYLTGVHAERLAEDSVDANAGGEGLRIVRVTLHDDTGAEAHEFGSGRPMTVRLHYRAARPIERPMFSVGLNDGRIGCFTLASMLLDGGAPDALEGEGHVDCAFEALPLQPKTYEIWGSVRGSSGYGDLVDWQRLRLFRVTDEMGAALGGSVTHALDDSPVKIPHLWSFETANKG